MEFHYISDWIRKYNCWVEQDLASTNKKLKGALNVLLDKGIYGESYESFNRHLTYGFGRIFLLEGCDLDDNVLRRVVWEDQVDKYVDAVMVGDYEAAKNVVFPK